MYLGNIVELFVTVCMVILLTCCCVAARLETRECPAVSELALERIKLNNM